jgi:hypothetical protein
MGHHTTAVQLMDTAKCLQVFRFSSTPQYIIHHLITLALSQNISRTFLSMPDDQMSPVSTATVRVGMSTGLVDKLRTPSIPILLLCIAHDMSCGSPRSSIAPTHVYGIACCLIVRAIVLLPSIGSDGNLPQICPPFLEVTE